LVLASRDSFGYGMKGVGSNGSSPAGRQQMQLLGYGGDEALENPHSLFQLLSLSALLTVRNEALHGMAGQVGDTPRTSLFARTAKLTELVFRDPEVD
jgi:hypothetical protein